jgi:predicted unusual protein kinase regulating ubiquinone biosynthesis (AarF/ABC1/UbiB family)
VILERAVSELFDRFGGVGVGELVQTDPRELREFALRFSDLVRTLPFQLPNDFLFLIRALSLISGVASSLNREFNLWDAVDPFARSLLNGAGNGVAKTLGKDLLAFANTLVKLPQRLDDLANRLERGEIVIRNPELEKRVRVLDGSVRRTTSALLFAGLLVAGIVLDQQQSSLSVPLVIVSAVPLIWRIR